ncbi:hypothetical protein HGM15179_016687 [Zosterops borbonicus]|uniref:Cadherin domain-containing protein n=1 Tax=Zosterops borbonicus TaxID=364589 RepID=A0A8K1LDZ2_9PASS|nr:hypothetical protein HGM15179_016687 [Zosterops borbonicus]
MVLLHPLELLIIILLLLLQVTAADSFSHEIENFSLRQAIRRKSIQWMDSYQSDSLPPLKRTKRSWIITTIDVQEEDKGPFPKYAGQLFNNRSYNTSLKYLISGPGVDEAPEVGLFSIEDDANAHVFVHRAIDRERTPDFQIRFDVENRKTGELLDRPIFFKIKVKDINDNTPEFSMEEYGTTIRENHSKDEPVIQVTALDKDEVGTVNSQVSYSIHMQTPSPDGLTFNIDPTTGWIFLSGCLDYQTANSFNLLIKASDHGRPQLSSTATVTVTVEDANNHLPVFTSDNYHLQISAGEEHPAVLRLQVEDKDSPNAPAWRAKYKITKGNEKEQFTIETDPATNEGILSVIKPLSYEGDSETLRLVISVANEEPFFWCKNGIVMISDLESTDTAVNIKVLQRAPRFHPPILVVQREDSMKPGRVFRKYPATYPDDVPNKIKYELAHDPDGWLSVDENFGVLTVAKEFDQESPFLNNSLYTIIVHAIDHGKPPQTGTGTILLYLSDINDHMPSLVAPALDVCHKEEGTSLIIEAKSALARSHSEPFTFELPEDSEDVKHNWTLGRNFGQSVELLMLRSLPQGSYLVPIIIQDKQGFSIRQNQHIRLCFCPDGHTCKNSPVPQAAVGLGSGAIVIVLMAFLLLLVSSIMLCQCYRSGAKSKAIAPLQEGEQTLINYNEESRSSFSENGCFTAYKTFQARHLDCFIQTVDRTLAQKVYYQSTLEDYGDICEPCRYTEEGELEASISPCSTSIGSEDLPDDFLDTLGPTFSALEEICQK